MTDAEDIIAFSENHAKSKGYRLGDGVRSVLLEKARVASAEITQMPIGEQQEKLQELQTNFTLMIEEMIKASKSIPGYSASHPGVIGEATLGEAFRKLCPLWPFCSGAL